MQGMSIVREISNDLGNAVIKGAIKDESVFKCEKIDNRVQVNRTGSYKEVRFQREGETEIILGVGDLQNNKLKHEREFLLEQSLVISSKLVEEDKFKMNLRVALPPTEFFNDTYVKRYKEKFPVGVHKFKIDGVDKEIEINNVSVYMEGYSAFLDIANNIKTTNNLLIFDLGGGTLDCIEVLYDKREKSFYPNKAESVRKGTIDLYGCIAADINKNGHSVKIEWIEEAIDCKEDSINSRYKVSENLSSAKIELKSMLNELANKLECSLGEYDIICIGGGSTIFNMLYDDKTNLIELDLDTLYCNAAGMLQQ